MLRIDEHVVFISSQLRVGYLKNTLKMFCGADSQRTIGSVHDDDHFEAGFLGGEVRKESSRGTVTHRDILPR